MRKHPQNLNLEDELLLDLYNIIEEGKSLGINIDDDFGVSPEELYSEGDYIPEQSEYVLSGGKLSINNIKLMLKASYEDAPERINDFILDKQLSGKYGVVYHNPMTNQTVVAHRGTKELIDWTNNLAYAVGAYKNTARYKTGKKMQQLAEKKYGAKNITTIGHSQGSALARELGQNTKEIITLNPAYKGEKPLKNEYNIRSSRDVVSVGLHGTNRGHDLLIPAQSYNPLTEHNIDILDRVDSNLMVGI